MKTTGEVKKNDDNVKKLLGEPISKEFSESILKIRRNLLIVSMLSCATIFWNLDVDSSSLFGIKFSGLTQRNLINGLFVVNSYLFFHYAWCCFDHFSIWRIRVSGTHTLYPPAHSAFDSGVSPIDRPLDPKQSTLYSWWIENNKNLKNCLCEIKIIKEEIAKANSIYQQLLDNKTNVSEPKVGNRTAAVHKARLEKTLDRKLDHLSIAIETSKTTLSSERILPSLETFDNWFQLSLRTQDLRWLVIDVVIPLFIGGFSLFTLLSYLF